MAAGRLPLASRLRSQPLSPLGRAQRRRCQVAQCVEARPPSSRRRVPTPLRERRKREARYRRRNSAGVSDLYRRARDTRGDSRENGRRPETRRLPLMFLPWSPPRKLTASFSVRSRSNEITRQPSSRAQSIAPASATMPVKKNRPIEGHGGHDLLKFARLRNSSSCGSDWPIGASLDCLESRTASSPGLSEQEGVAGTRPTTTRGRSRLLQGDLNPLQM